MCEAFQDLAESLRPLEDVLEISLEDEPEEFVAVLRPVLGCKIGLTVMRWGEGLVVTSVHDGSIVESWNAARPAQSIEERDLIVQINDSKEYLKMLHHFRSSPVLLLKVQRQEAVKPLASFKTPLGCWAVDSGRSHCPGGLSSSRDLVVKLIPLRFWSPTWRCGASLKELAHIRWRPGRRRRAAQWSISCNKRSFY